ncbi:ABC transporter permease [Spirillospora sp. CA-294931]|uniref:ABC transporter permease n=1 Tax=Spirillospora sp. CA-294931 TaxID=3240042 RepID=UPI003D9034B7
MTAIAVKAPPGRISPQRTARHALTLAWRNVVQLRHSPEKLLDVTLMPVVFLLLFLYVFGGAISGSTHAYLQQLLPGLVAQMAMFGTMGLGVALNEDIHKGVFDRFRSLPIARSAPLIGSVLGDTVRFCMMMVMLVAFGSLLGFRFHTDPLSVMAAFALAYVFYLAVSWISVLVGLFAPSPDTVQGLAMLWVMPLTFGSSVLMPNTSTMPGWLEAWAKVNPVSHLAESVRALMVGGPVGNHVWYTLAWAAAIVAVTFPIAMRLYARRV